jgi:hypothetical protein
MLSLRGQVGQNGYARHGRLVADRIGAKGAQIGSSIESH